MENGKAYGIFYCDASKEAIEQELPTIRDLVQTPSQLELTLVEGMDNVRGNANLVTLAKQAQEQGMRYALEATYPGTTNEVTANELSGILNQAYQSPLYKDGEPFSGAVVYEENGEYVFKE